MSLVCWVQMSPQHTAWSAASPPCSSHRVWGALTVHTERVCTRRDVGLAATGQSPCGGAVLEDLFRCHESQGVQELCPDGESWEHRVSPSGSGRAPYPRWKPRPGSRLPARGPRALLSDSRCPPWGHIRAGGFRKMGGVLIQPLGGYRS